MPYRLCVPGTTTGGRGWVGRTLPGLWQLGRYQRSWLRGDLLAGVTVAAYLIPQVMAYAEIAGLPAVTGLWAVVGALAVYSLTGSWSQLSVGPESSTAPDCRRNGHTRRQHWPHACRRRCGSRD